MAQDYSTPHRVALVTGGLKLGGTTTFLHNLGSELLARGIPVEVLSFERENPLASDFNRSNIPVLSQDDRHLIYEDRLRIILRRLSQFKPTVVLANLSGISFEVLRYLPSGVFRIGTVQSDDPRVYAMVRFYATHVDLMAAVSKTIQETLKAMPEFAQVPVRYLPYGVPMPTDRLARDFQGVLRVLYLGRLDREQKRVHWFPAILKQLADSGIPFHWTIAGEGGERNSLEQAMRSSDTSQSVSFTGKVTYADVPRLLSQHDIFLLASDYEGLPLSLIEAMGAGLVPVVSDLPSGIRELVDETTGRRVPPDHIEGYAAEILWLHQHREELCRLSSAAREKVRREFSTGTMADRWLAAFPKSAATDIVWPRRWAVKPPLCAQSRLHFSPLVRAIRRLAIRLRS